MGPAGVLRVDNVQTDIKLDLNIETDTILIIVTIVLIVAVFLG